MANDPFQPILQGTSTAGITKAPVSPSGLATALDVGSTLIPLGVDVARKVRDIGDVNEFKGTIQTLQDQAAATDAEIVSTGEQIDEADAAKVSDLTRRLTRLALGREQGMLTSSQALARASIEFKKLVAENPHLENELRNVIETSRFGISKAGRASGASAQADMLTAAATKREELINGIILEGGVSRRTAESFVQSQHDFAQIKLSNDIALAQGTAGVNSMLAGVNAEAQSAQYSLLGQLNNMLVNNPGDFNPETYASSVTEHFLILERNWLTSATAAGQQLTSGQREEAVSIFRDTRDMVIKSAGGRDPLAQMTRINQILDQEEKNIAAEFLKNAGPQFQLMEELGSKEQVFNTLFNTIPKAIGTLTRNGDKFDALVQAAEDSGDSDMIFALQFAQSRPTLTVKQWRDQLNGDLSGTKAQQELNRSISGKVLNDSIAIGVGEDRPKVFDFLSKNAEDVVNSDIPTNVSAIYQPSFTNKMTQDGKLAKFVQSKLINKLAASISEIQSFEVELTIDEEALQQPITVERSLFKRRIAANDVLKLSEGSTPKAGVFDISPFTGRKSTRRFDREMNLLNEYVAGLHASGMSSSQINNELNAFIERAGPPSQGDSLGLRPDGSEKGLGFFGELQRPDGKVSTELSGTFGVLDGSGNDVLIPMLTPNLSKEDVNTILNLDENEFPPANIQDKFKQHARERLAKGLTPFASKAEEGQTPSPLNPIPSSAQGDVEAVAKPTELIKQQEGFSSTKYKDGNDFSVGHGFFLPSLEADEKALIADIDNITEAEADAVLDLKVNKLDSMWNKEVEGFDTLSEEAQSALISMAYQLGSDDITGNKWPKMLTALRRAVTLPEGSDEREGALDQVAVNMVFNISKSGRRTFTKWAKTTKSRAIAMAEAIGDPNARAEVK